MRKLYLNHYWSLFFDFIDTFEDLKYKDIPLPLLCNFYKYIDEDLKQEMLKPDFKKYLKTKQLSEDQIQSNFEKLLNPIKKPLQTKPVPGKVLLNFDYLRFSPKNYSECFNPQQTIIFARWKKKEYLGIPVHNIKDYTIDVSELTQNFIEKANTIFLVNNDHLLFRNQYFRKKLVDDIPRMIESLVAVNRYLDEVPISCIIVGTTEDWVSRILTVIAVSKGIPSICMQHGIIGGEEAFMPVFATKMAVYGQYEKDWYLQKGVSPDRIAIIGHPCFDEIFTEKHMSKVAFQEKYGLNAKKKWILLATQPFHDLFWIQLIDGLAKDSRVEVAIKPHPWEISYSLIRNYKYFSEKYQSVKLISKLGVNLYDILPNVDVVVVNSSTVGLEAMLFDKPALILSKTHYKYYDKMGNFVQSDPEKLVKLITQLVQDGKLQKVAKERREEFLTYAYPEKLSGKRLLELIYKLTADTTGST